MFSIRIFLKKFKLLPEKNNIFQIILFHNPKCQSHYEQFAHGFFSVVKDQLTNILGIFRPQELMSMVVGETNYNWVDLEKNTKYHQGYNERHENIRRFWNVFHGLSLEHKKTFMLFLTGSSKIPIGGTTLNIQHVASGEDHLPVAHTCFNLLDLPIYRNEKQMKDKLLLAIGHNKGFQLV